LVNRRRKAEEVILESVLERERVRVWEGWREMWKPTSGRCFFWMKTMKAQLKWEERGGPAEE
jgi:hypothetical protein